MEDEAGDDGAAVSSRISPSRRKGMGMSYERSTESLVRMSSRMLADRDELQHLKSIDAAVDLGMQEQNDVENVRRLLKKRAGSVVGGWRADMDLRGAHFVGEADWFKVLRKIGFAGNGTLAWRRLSRGKAQVTLADLDPEAAELLSEFYVACRQEIGRLSDLLEDSDSLRVGKARFCEKCALLRKKSKNSHRKDPVNLDGVFRNLQTVPGMLTAADFAWLEHYCERGKKPQEPDTDIIQGLTRQEELALKARKKAVQDFKTLLQHRFGSLPRAWRALLDRDGNGAITGEDLEVIVEALEFPTEATDLWDQIVGADADVMTLKDLCPEAVTALKAFKSTCAECFGSLVKAFEEWDAENKPLVAKEEFRLFCREIKFDQNWKLAFDFLDERNVGHILLASVDEKATATVFGSRSKSSALAEYRGLEPLPAKTRRVDIATRAAEQCAESQREPEDQRQHRRELLAVLKSRWESPVRAWGAVFDKQGKGKLTQNEFFVGCSVAGYTGSKSKLWEELKLKPTQSVRLRDIAPEAMGELGKFKTLSGKQFGRIITAMEAAAPPSAKKDGAKVTEEEFKSLCTRIGYKGRAKTLMKHFDPDGVGHVNSKSLKNFHEEKKDEKAMTGMMRKHNEIKQGRWQEKLAGMRVAPTQELRAKQDQLLTMGRDQRAQRVEPEKNRKKLLSFLSKKFGSIAKAWKLALSPSDAQELNVDAFLDGLKRAGALEAAPKHEDVDKFQRLHAYLISGDEQATGVRLYHLDRRIEDQLEEVKQRCAERYGTIWQAFDEFDPEATGKISKQDFISLCHEIKVTDGVYRLLHYLDPESEHEVNLEDIDKDAVDDARDACNERKEEIKNKEARDERLKRTHMTTVPRKLGSSVGVEARQEERKAEAGQRVLKELKSKLVKRHGNLVRAWREVVSPDGKKSITYEGFERACLQMGVEGDAALGWKALGFDVEGDDEEGDGPKAESGAKRGGKETRLTLERFDPSIAQDLRELKIRVQERYCSYFQAFAEIDPEARGHVSLNTFLMFCFECQFRRNDRRLFEFLSKDGNRLNLNALDKKAMDLLKKKKGKAIKSRSEQSMRDEASQDEDDEGDMETMSESATSATMDAAVEAVPRQDPAQAFRELCVRRFGSTVRAWKALDPQGVAVLSKQEFVKSVSATGYAGGQNNLWTALAGSEKWLSLKELDPDGFELLVTFRRAMVGHFSALERAFEAKGKPTKSYDLEEFCKLCQTAGLPKPHPPYFEMLASRDAVGWNEVRFLEDWDWQDGEERPLRQQPRERGPRSPAGAPPRVVGQGALHTSMRPRKVTMAKSNSLPSLFTPLRAQWNDRHQVPTHKGNKDEQTLHLMCYVQTQEAERCRRRVAKQMTETSTAQWIAENVPDSDNEYDDFDAGD